ATLWLSGKALPTASNFCYIRLHAVRPPQAQGQPERADHPSSRDRRAAPRDARSRRTGRARPVSLASDSRRARGPEGARDLIVAVREGRLHNPAMGFARELFSHSIVTEDVIADVVTEDAE